MFTCKTLTSSIAKSESLLQRKRTVSISSVRYTCTRGSVHPCSEGYSTITTPWHSYWARTCVVFYEQILLRSSPAPGNLRTMMPYLLYFSHEVDFMPRIRDAELVANQSFPLFDFLGGKPRPHHYFQTRTCDWIGLRVDDNRAFLTASLHKKTLFPASTPKRQIGARNRHRKQNSRAFDRQADLPGLPMPPQATPSPIIWARDPPIGQ